MSLTSLYSLTKEFVQHFPKHSLKCNSLQTFAVLEDYSALTSPNLAKTILDAKKPFFYSSDWAKANYNPSKLTYSYPAMFMLERPGDISEAFCNTSKTCYNIEIALLDKYDRACAEKGVGCKECAQRTINDLYLSAERFIKIYFKYMSEVIYIEDIGYINKQIWIKEGSPGVIDQKRTRLFQKHLAESNRSNPIIRFHGGLDDLYGVIVEIKYCYVECGQFEYDPTIKDFKIGPDLGCC